jgi:hypothetical protein
MPGVKERCRYSLCIELRMVNFGDFISIAHKNVS